MLIKTTEEFRKSPELQRQLDHLVLDLCQHEDLEIRASRDYKTTCGENGKKCTADVSMTVLKNIDRDQIRNYQKELNRKLRELQESFKRLASKDTLWHYRLTANTPFFLSGEWTKEGGCIISHSTVEVKSFDSELAKVVILKNHLKTGQTSCSKTWSQIFSREVGRHEADEAFAESQFRNLFGFVFETLMEKDVTGPQGEYLNAIGGVKISSRDLKSSPLLQALYGKNSRNLCQYVATQVPRLEAENPAPYTRLEKGKRQPRPSNSGSQE